MSRTSVCFDAAQQRWREKKPFLTGGAAASVAEGVSWCNLDGWPHVISADRARAFHFVKTDTGGTLMKEGFVSPQAQTESTQAQRNTVETPVVFRKGADGKPFALFPAEPGPGSASKEECKAYFGEGCYGSVPCDETFRGSQASTPEEHHALALDLCKQGVNPVIQRFPDSAMAGTRGRKFEAMEASIPLPSVARIAPSVGLPSPSEVQQSRNLATALEK